MEDYGYLVGYFALVFVQGLDQNIIIPHEHGLLIDLAQWNRVFKSLSSVHKIKPLSVIELGMSLESLYGDQLHVPSKELRATLIKHRPYKVLLNRISVR